MSEPTDEDRKRWATYAVNAGYAKWSEKNPTRTTANKEAYFTLFMILGYEHKLHKANELARVKELEARVALLEEHLIEEGYSLP